jgi:multimeric flavodoxin WrbA
MDTSLNVLILNASLKHSAEPSNTEELALQVVEEMKKHASITSEVIRLSDKIIPVGLGLKESEDDEWPSIVEKIKSADIILFATPIWWGSHSSLMQRIIERMDAFDEEYIHGGRSVLLNKVAGVVITGSEDGAQSALAHLLSTLSFMNFTIPPQCCTYYVGEVGMDSETVRNNRRTNAEVKEMAEHSGKNLVYYARLLNEHPLRA